MGRNKKYISVVKDKEQGNWAYRGVSGEKEIRKRYQELRNKGIEPDNIDILPVRSPSLGLSEVLGVLNVICTIVEVWIFFKGNQKKK